MEIVYHTNFRRNFKKRIAPNSTLTEKFQKRLEILLENPNSPQLKNHRLIGSKNKYSAFSVSGNVRVVYRIENDTLFLYDIGTHNQVY